MEDKSQFLVNPDSDPVAIRVEGKANFKNCSGMKDFLNKMIQNGKHRFVMDFESCTGMDSTFLGVMAGAALQLRKTTPRGSLVVSHLNERNNELVHNLGLNRLLTVDDGVGVSRDDTAFLQTAVLSDEIQAARAVLDAHRNLVEVDDENAAKFRDVMSFCEKQIGEGS
ncbi:MAG: STAS domain-containing protein [Opitutaceae bacterium]|nr:STAS domain-containing protein [Opitutaceae bacterium]